VIVIEGVEVKFYDPFKNYYCEGI